MTPAEFKAAREARAPWSDARIRDALAKAIEEAEAALDLGVHIHLPLHAYERARQIARCGLWLSTATPHGVRKLGAAHAPALDPIKDAGTIVRLDLAPCAPESMLDLDGYRGELHSVMGSETCRRLPIARSHAEFVAARKPWQPAMIEQCIKDAIAAALLSDDGVPKLQVPRHSAQAAVDRAAVDGWLAYAMQNGQVLTDLPRVEAPVNVELHLTGERWGWKDQDEWREHDSLRPTPRARLAPGLHSHSEDPCDACAIELRRSAEAGCRFSPQRANGACDQT